MTAVTAQMRVAGSVEQLIQLLPNHQLMHAWCHHLCASATFACKAILHRHLPPNGERVVRRRGSQRTHCTSIVLVNDRQNRCTRLASRQTATTAHSVRWDTDGHTGNGDNGVWECVVRHMFIRPCRQAVPVFLDQSTGPARNKPAD